MELKYNVEGMTLILKPLKIKQLEELAELVGSFEVDPNMSGWKDLISVIRQKAIGQFMTVIFPQPGVEDIDWSEVEYDVVDGIFEDFLSCNPRLTKRLTGFLQNFVPLIGRALTNSEKSSVSK